MRIVFVRHGDPDYEKDCLTDLGHRQAEAVADRLSEENFQHIYSSSCGRAAQTAEHIAKLHNMKVELLDFMKETPWGAIDGKAMNYGGNPWLTTRDMVLEGQNLVNMNWEKEEPFCRNKVISSAHRVWQEFDALLAEIGYKREGEFYRVCSENDNTYAVVSHAGSSGAALAHIFNLPLPFLYRSVPLGLTSVTIVKFNGKTGELTAPKFEILNDTKHIEPETTENIPDN